MSIPRRQERYCAEDVAKRQPRNAKYRRRSMNSATAPQPATSAKDEKLSPEDVAKARQFLQQTQTIVIGATKSVSGAQWKFKTSPDRWSIAEILDHIVIVQERVLDRILD